MERPRFFCLRGFMKSGTNWLGELLSSHPDICCVGEFHWQEVLEGLFKRPDPLRVFGDAEFYRHALTQFESAIRRSMIKAVPENTKLIGERTPTTLAPVILRNTPHVTIVRDGRDVLVSRAFHLYNRPEVSRVFTRFKNMADNLAQFQADRWFFHQFPGKLLNHKPLVVESARWWREHLESDRKTCETNPRLPVLTIRYEDLHREFQPTLKNVFEFLKVDSSFAERTPDELKPGFEKESPNEFKRKGQVGDWKNYFTPKVKEWFVEEAGEELLRQGYVDSHEW